MNDQDSYYLAIDIGTGSVRVALFKGVPLGRDFFDFFTGAGLFGLLLG